jgi:hypothetical protein
MLGSVVDVEAGVAAAKMDGGILRFAIADDITEDLQQLPPGRADHHLSAREQNNPKLRPVHAKESSIQYGNPNRDEKLHVRCIMPFITDKQELLTKRFSVPLSCRGRTTLSFQQSPHVVFGKCLNAHGLTPGRVLPRYRHRMLS